MTLDEVKRIDHFTVQPRDFNVAEEADYDVRFFDRDPQALARFPAVVYIEWVEQDRQRPTDKGTVPSGQMKTLYPAVTWEESMAAMLLYGEDLQRKVGRELQGGQTAAHPAQLPWRWAGFAT